VAAIQAKNLELAKTSFESSRNLAEEIGSQWEKINSALFLGYVRAQSGDRDEGIRLIEQTLQESCDLKFWPLYCEGQLLFAQLLKAEGAVDQARSHLELARTKALEMGFSSLVQRCQTE
jgi:hypothetical protein